MSGPVYSINDQAERLMGRRPEGVLPFDQPPELGYWCPVCRVLPLQGENYDERLEWSEYKGFLWCSVCNFDYPSALCVRLEGEPQTSNDWEHHGRDSAVEIFLRTVADAVDLASKDAPPLG